MKRAAAFLLLSALLAACISCSRGSPEAQTAESSGGPDTAEEDKYPMPVFDTEFRAEIDFSERDYSRTPYLKKFDMFSCTWSWCSDFSSDPVLTKKNVDLIPDIALLLPESVRTDLFMGYHGIGRNIGKNGGSGTTDAEFRLVRQLTDALKKTSLRAEFMYFASPEYTGGGTENNAWKSVDDLKKWEDLCFNIAKYFSDNGMNVIRHEIWNEPDYADNGNGVFYAGSWQDYIDLYIAGARGIRRADPDALVGGVSAAFIHDLYKNGNYGKFLSQSLDAGMLPDYVSWHFYGSNGGMKMLEQYIAAARAGLEESEKYSTVQQCLNEFNVSLDNSTIKGYRMVQMTLDAFEQLLNATDITRVNWTSALDRENDDNAALIDPRTGERRPAYYAQWMYARLPVSAVKAVSDTGRVGIMAAAGDTRCGAIIYDRSMESTEITLSFSDLPFDDCTVTVYSIDSENPQGRVTSDTPLCIAKTDLTGTKVDYSVIIPENGAIYVEFDKKDAPSDVHERVSELAENIVRTDYWYNGRDNGGAYAWFGSNSLMACVGSGTSEKSDGCAVAATIRDMSGRTLVFDVTVSENAAPDGQDAMFGITVDYSAGGSYVKKVYYSLNGADTFALMPLGTGKAPDVVTGLGTGSGSYAVRLDDYAPEGWDGRIMLTFVCNGMKKGIGAEFIVNTGEH